jgi:hypothetical protein
VSATPDLDLARIRRFCEGRVPVRARHQVRLEVEVGGSAVTIIERRAPWSPEVGPEWSRLPIARLRFSPSRGEWALFWCDHNLAFHRHPDAPSTRTIDELLAVLAHDPLNHFWG